DRAPDAFSADVRVIGHDREVDRRLVETELCTRRVRVLVVVAVVEVAVSLDVLPGEAECGRVVDGDVDRRRALDGVVVADLGVDEAARFADHGPSGDHVDGTAGRVASVESTLRAFEHFYPLQVVEQPGGRCGPRQVHAVQV